MCGVEKSARPAYRTPPGWCAVDGVGTRAALPSTRHLSTHGLAGIARWGRAASPTLSAVARSPPSRRVVCPRVEAIAATPSPDHCRCHISPSRRMGRYSTYPAATLSGLNRLAFTRDRSGGSSPQIHCTSYPARGARWTSRGDHSGAGRGRNRRFGVLQ